MNAQTLGDIIKDHQIFHSNFQVDHFIVGGDCPTLYGRYRQTLRELVRRIRSLKYLYVKRERLKIDHDRTLQIPDAEDDLDLRSRELDRLEVVMGMEELDRVIADTEREFRRFYAHAEQG